MLDVRQAAARAQARQQALRSLPKVQMLLDLPEATALAALHSRPLLRQAVRDELARERTRLLAHNVLEPASFSTERFFAAVEARLTCDAQRGPQRVINATGIVIHTNLGRAPLADAALHALQEIGRGYSNLEFDLRNGTRGSRYEAVEALLCELTGAEAALVVNNNAAALLLALTGMAAPGEVVISRGELIEIGGSFRLPDVVRQSGAKLVEVGTTNKTRLADYEAAVTAETRVLLKVHQSNFRLIGFAATTPVSMLASLASARGLALIEDLGSGSLVDLRRLGLPAEPTVADSLRKGADLATFSGDKLLGGPQAGIIVGRRELIAKLKRVPLLRALRIDKLSLAALAATLRLYRHPEALRAVPVIRMLSQSEAELRRRARRIGRLLGERPGLDLRIEQGVAYAGGGALPEAALPTAVVSLAASGFSVDALARRLRAGRPPVIGRIAQGRFLMDMRTVGDEEVPAIVAALRAALA